MKKNTLIFLLAFVCSIISFEQNGQCTTQFVIAPPPIASPTFEAGKKNSRIDFNYISFSADSFSAQGVGGDFKTRSALSNFLAIDFQGGIFVMVGDNDDASSDMTMTMTTMPLSINLEIQPIKTEKFNTILFGGLVCSLGSNHMVFTDSTTGSENTMQSTTTMVGYQAGIQMGIHTPAFVFSPFAFTVIQTGETDVDGNIYDIEEYKTNSFGFDIMHRETGITLSSVVDFASQVSNDKDDEDVEIFTLKIGKSF